MARTESSDSRSLLEEAQRRLRRLSPPRLRVANDFLAYLEEREDSQATAELLSIPGFEEAFRQAVAEADAGEVLSSGDIHRKTRGFGG